MNIKLNEFGNSPRRVYKNLEEAEVIQYDNAILNFVTHILTNKNTGETIKLTPTENALFLFIVNYNIQNNSGPNTEQIHNFLYSKREDGGANAFNPVLSRLNAKLSKLGISFTLNSSTSNKTEYIIKKEI